jgi:uncharacterized protein
MTLVKLVAPAQAGAQVGARILVRIAMLFCATLIACLNFSLAFATEGDPQPVPSLKTRVTDLTGTLSSTDEQHIEAKLRAFEMAKGSQVAVLIVPTTQPEAIFEFSMRVAESWKIGRKGVGDGVLFVVAKNDRKMQILAGPGLQGSLTDAMSKRIIAEVVAPRFRSGDFAGGIEQGTDKIIGLLQGEALPPPPAKRRASIKADSGEGLFVLALIGAVVAGSVLRALLGRFLGASVAAGATGVAAWWVAGGLMWPLGLGLIVFAVVLSMGWSGLSSRGGHGGWISTSSGSDWGGGGGSSDSFTGGGGSFDGGGASGDW